MTAADREYYSNLFTAAPELLAALKDAEEWLLEVAENQPEDYNNRALKSTLKRINDVICKVERRGQWRVSYD